jgi:hypothetical protein
MNNKKMSDGLIWLSIVTAVVAGYVSFTQTDVFALAGTQWMMIAIVLGIYGIYVKMRVAN